MNDSTVNALLEEVATLRREVSRLRDESQIRDLQYRYGYYDDVYDFDRLLDLFADDCSVEIGARGKYIGKERVARFFREVIADNHTRLSRNQVYDHIQLQMIITVDPDGTRARGRARALILGSRGEGTNLHLGEGIYENTYVKRGGVWKIEHMYWAPTFYTKVTGIEPIAFSGVPESKSFPPDEPARRPDPDIGRVMVACHF